MVEDVSLFCEFPEFRLSVRFVASKLGTGIFYRRKPGFYPRHNICYVIDLWCASSAYYFDCQFTNDTRSCYECGVAPQAVFNKVGFFLDVQIDRNCRFFEDIEDFGLSMLEALYKRSLVIWVLEFDPNC